jgi:hypothetical protein
MVRRVLTGIGWGTAGVAVAAALIAGAFVVAGTRLTAPATPIRVSAPPLVALIQPTSARSTAPPPSSPSPSGEDASPAHASDGGSRGTGSGSDENHGASPAGGNDHDHDDD